MKSFLHRGRGKIYHCCCRLPPYGTGKPANGSHHDPAAP
jgi:hypothetical protein